jgi:hypothetical protein
MSSDQNCAQRRSSHISWSVRPYSANAWVVVPIGSVKTGLEIFEAEFVLPRVASPESVQLSSGTQPGCGVDVDEISLQPNRVYPVAIASGFMEQTDTPWFFLPFLIAFGAMLPWPRSAGWRPRLRTLSPSGGRGGSWGQGSGWFTCSWR